jgi:hypothetical protein
MIAERDVEGDVETEHFDPNIDNERSRNSTNCHCLKSKP